MDTSSRTTLSVAGVSRKGPREANEDRFFAVMDERTGAWVIAVADGLGGHTRGREAAAAAVKGLPRSISSKEELAQVFAQANQRVADLCDREDDGSYETPWMAPMSTLAVAAWSHAGGLLVGWAGDTLAFRVTNCGSKRPNGRVVGYPHTGFLGGVGSCLGADTPSDIFTPEGTKDFAIKAVSTRQRTPTAVLIASDGAWLKCLLKNRESAWAEELDYTDIVGPLCRDVTSAQDVAKAMLDKASEYGLTDNATVAVAFTS